MVDSLSTEELIALSALVSTSGHPVASSMRETLLAKGLYRREGSWSVEETVGLGVSARMDGKLWRLGRSEWAGGQASDSTTLTVDGKVVAEFMFSNEPWADAASEIDAIEQMRIRVQVLSGDAQAKVDLAAVSLGLPKHKALGGLLPQEKEDWLRANDSEHSLMVGDGANDSLAFDVALVAGTPAVEKTVLSSKADFYYLGTGIQGVRYLLDVAKGRKRGVVYLLSFALLYNVVIVGAALSNVITPVLAAVFMPLSSLVSLGIVWLNALRQERTPRNAP